MRSLGVALFAFLVSSHAFAYALGDHSQITRVAVREFNDCFKSDVIGSSVLDVIERGDLDEDFDLLNKWLYYSHFYNPTREVEQRRASALVRTTELAEALEMDLDRPSEATQDDIYSTLGGVLHFLQDVTCPPHVVPVMHSFTDGFESFDEEVVPLDSSNTQAACDRMLKSQSRGFVRMFKDTALMTLDKLRDRVQIIRNGQPFSINWFAFWYEPSDNQFGNYGFLGNHFGDTFFDDGKFFGSDSHYQVPVNVYREFKQAQLRAAVEVTKESIYRVYKRLKDR